MVRFICLLFKGQVHKVGPAEVLSQPRALRADIPRTLQECHLANQLNGKDLKPEFSKFLLERLPVGVLGGGRGNTVWKRLQAWKQWRLQSWRFKQSWTIFPATNCVSRPLIGFRKGLTKHCRSPRGSLALLPTVTTFQFAKTSPFQEFGLFPFTGFGKP